MSVNKQLHSKMRYLPSLTKGQLMFKWNTQQNVYSSYLPQWGTAAIMTNVSVSCVGLLVILQLFVLEQETINAKPLCWQPNHPPCWQPNHRLRTESWWHTAKLLSLSAGHYWKITGSFLLVFTEPGRGFGGRIEATLHFYDSASLLQHFGLGEW